MRPALRLYLIILCFILSVSASFLPAEHVYAANRSITIDQTAVSMSDDDRIYFLDMIFPKRWRSDAILIESNGRYGLIDTGVNTTLKVTTSLNGQNYWALKERLQAIGVKKLDFVIITHLHQDHATGFISLIKDFPCDKVYLKSLSPTCLELNSVMVGKEVLGLGFYKALSSSNVGSVVYVDQYAKNQTYSFSMEDFTFDLFNLEPGKCSLAKKCYRENEDSIVTLARVHGRSILMCGDLGTGNGSHSRNVQSNQNVEEILKQVVAVNGSGNIDVFKPPHHGYLLHKSAVALFNHALTIQNIVTTGARTSKYKQTKSYKISSGGKRYYAGSGTVVVGFGDDGAITYCQCKNRTGPFYK